jgi:hypothetical protein
VHCQTSPGTACGGGVCCDGGVCTVTGRSNTCP